jgi:4-hydroxythreonine-4-phosphate dehydrogenase
MKPRIGISLGDVTGVGPEVTLKALEALGTGDASFTLIGNPDVLQHCKDRLGLRLDLSREIRVADNRQETRPSGTVSTTLVDLPPGAAPAARAAVDWIREGARLCLAGELDALVTAPVNKHAIVQAGIPFTGHTELLSEIAGEPRTVMMLLGPDEKARWLRVALATIHMALREVPVQLTTDKVLLAVQRAAQACRDLGLARTRIGVCGLNPHAGEGGEFGDEEARIIEPAIQQAREEGLEVAGPLSGDTVFHQALQGDYDAVVAMYHDQGLAPLKLAAFNTGVNWTLGLPFIRTSPDHGTAYNIAGRGIADPTSMISAIRLAAQLAGQQTAVPS